MPYAVPFQPPLVRAEINELRIGSLFETFTFLVPAFLAQPDVRAVLQNLVASVIFEIAKSRISGVRTKNTLASSRPPTCSPRPPALDVGTNIKNVVSALSANGGGNVRLKHRTPQGDVYEVEIVVAHNEARA
ncbi:MAG: hypothetical protein RMK97_10705 [Sutterellaceae bacterium]|nr:hypothetical protein [Burkholderiaceae bacterium]MDW8430952.1 hypothetical protein [Sutterellaceae bacterium]